MRTLSRLIRYAVLFLLFAYGFVRDAHAQTDNRLAVGLSVTARVAGSEAAGSSADVGFEWRLGHDDESAWGWQTSLFGWFDTGLQNKTGAETTGGRELRIRPVMVGYGYTWVRKRASMTLDLVGGWSFNSLHLDSSARAEYRQLGVNDVQTNATNTFAVKPEVQIWYDLTRRVGLRLNGGYLITRPTVTVTSALGTERSSIRADSVLFTIGLVYSIL